MRRRITPTAKVELAQIRVDYIAQMRETMIANVKDKMTFSEIGTLIGQCHEWVRVRLVPLAEGPNPKIVRTPTGRYHVPRAVTVELIMQTFGSQPAS